MNVHIPVAHTCIAVASPNGDQADFSTRLASFVHDVVTHSGQHLIYGPETSGAIVIQCPSFQDVGRAQNSARLFEKSMHPHTIRIFDGRVIAADDRRRALQ